jgi:prepilin-type N-terminal cleavage/methylation domain-containing protein
MRRHGFTLLELMLVLAILTALGAVVIVDLAAERGEPRLEAGAAEVASALRFARAEALRTGEPHGVRITSADHRVRVYRLDTSGASPVEDFSVRYPLDKRLYDLSLDAEPVTAGVKIGLSDFRFGGDSTPRQSVCFAPDGTPVSALDLAPLDSGTVQVSHDAGTRSVDVAPVTGRVTVQ